MKTVIYSTSSCAACHTLTNWLDSKNVSYEKRVIDENSNDMEEFMSLNDGMIGVPFSVIYNDDGKIQSKITGFEPKKFSEVL
jgi:glutaredoxin